MRKYLSNLLVWMRGIAPRVKHLLDDPMDFRRWGHLFIYYFIDVLANTVRGGDPRISLSQSVWVDRNDYKLNRVINAIANFLFHKRGPKLLPFGEGSDDDLSFSDRVQLILTIFWLIVIGLIVF